MSVYRKFNNFPANDIHAYSAVREQPAIAAATSNHDPADEVEQKRLRKAEPANHALPRTLQWAAGLPPNVQPVALLRHYARIANVIAATWTDGASFDTYMDSLFLERRANRRGFPLDVLSELLAIKRYHHTGAVDNQPRWHFSRRRA